MNCSARVEPGDGQESVWDYPRPPRLERTDQHIEIVLGGVTVASTLNAVGVAYHVLETSHPPTYYLPPDAFVPGSLRPATGSSFCEWKGHAVYWHLAIGGEVLRDVAWSYPEPTPAFAVLRDHVAFYAAPFDRCSVDGETVVPQPGGFYGGWVTSRYAGPFKGGPGSLGW